MAISRLPGPVLDKVIAAQIPAEPRLVKAAHQFEAMRMKELLAPLAQSGDVLSDPDEDQKGILCEFASESLAGALSAVGGLGIVNRIVHAVSRSGNSSGTPGVIGKSKNDTELSVSK